MKETFLKYKIANMTLNEKIGQMMMIDYRDVLEMNADFEKLLVRYQPGGFVLFKSNVINYRQTKKLLSDIKYSNGIPIMAAVDQEGGRVQRLDNRVGFDKYPNMADIGKTRNTDMAFNLGIKMGSELKEIGIDMNMAPVLDIFSNPQNKVIGTRAFGTDSGVVSEMALAYAKGLIAGGVMPVGKHFPGHGDTFKDSHIDLPIIEKSLNELESLELVPFIHAINKKIPGLMVAHIALPKVTLNNEPASLSKKMVSKLLRNNLGYDGLIMPDSLKMKALTNYYNDDDIYLKCVEAGNDFLLMPNNLIDAYNTIYMNIDNGTIPMHRIDESVYRILNMKFDLGFFDSEYNKFVNTKQLVRKK